MSDKEHCGQQMVSYTAEEHVQEGITLQQYFVRHEKNLHTKNSLSYSPGKVWDQKKSTSFVLYLFKC